MGPSGILRSVTLFFTAVSRQPIGSVLQGQEIQESQDFLTLEYGTNRSSQNVGKELPLYAS
jgi:hypothetical protein